MGCFQKLCYLFNFSSVLCQIHYENSSQAHHVSSPGGQKRPWGSSSRRATRSPYLATGPSPQDYKIISNKNNCSSFLAVYLSHFIQHLCIIPLRLLNQGHVGSSGRAAPWCLVPARPNPRRKSNFMQISLQEVVFAKLSSPSTGFFPYSPDLLTARPRRLFRPATVHLAYRRWPQGYKPM